MTDDEPILRGHKGDSELSSDLVPCSSEEFSAALKDPNRDVMDCFRKPVGSLNYVVGDATQPIGGGPKFIIHCCNDVGLWGAGFVLALSRRWPGPEECYYLWNDMDKETFKLGEIQDVNVEFGDGVWVINMIGQHGVGVINSISPIRYSAIRECLKKVADLAFDPVFRGEFRSCSIHAPRFGAGLAGGDWDIIEVIINEELVEKGLSVTVYDFEE